MDRPPEYPSKATLARELDVSESTISEMVRRGILPPPLKLSAGCVRWCWKDVQASLTALSGGQPNTGDDPFLDGVRNVTAAK